MPAARLIGRKLENTLDFLVSDAFDFRFLIKEEGLLLSDFLKLEAWLDGGKFLMMSG